MAGRALTATPASLRVGGLPVALRSSSGVGRTLVVDLGAVGVVIDMARVFESHVVLELVARHEAEFAVRTLSHVCHGPSVALLRSPRTTMS